MPVESIFKMGSSSVNEVSTSGRSNESDNEGEVGLEQFPGFPGQLVSYPLGSDAFKEFCKAKPAVGGKWGNCVEFVEYFGGNVWSDLSEGFLCYLSQLEYGLSLPLTNLEKGIMNAIGTCHVQLNGNMREIITVCDHLNERWEREEKRDDEEPLDLRFRTVKQSVKSTVERKKSLLVEVVEEETILELVLEGLGLSRRKRVDSKSDKVRKAQSTRLIAGVDEGKKQISSEEVQTKTPGSGSSAQPNLTTSKIAQKYLKKWMLMSLPASNATESGEVAKEKRRKVESSGEKVTEVRPSAVDDLREVKERAKLAALHREEDTSKMVVHLVKWIWLSIEEEKSKMKREKSELEKVLARAKTKAMKEVRQLKTSHIVAIGQLQVKAKGNLDEVVEERDRLGRHLMLKGYSREEVDAIKADTYVEEEDEEEAEAVGVVDGLDGVSCQTVLDNQGDDVELPEGGSEKVGNELERMTQKFIEKDDELRLARENLSASEAATEHLQTALSAKDMEFREIQRRCNDLNVKVARLKAELAQAIAFANKAEAREGSGGSRIEVKAPLVRGDV
ncbi:hypothetical protein GIB67_024042, partial [Kingdonia uniflora]